jgi:hypothetical protein
MNAPRTYWQRTDATSEITPCVPAIASTGLLLNACTLNEVTAPPQSQHMPIPPALRLPVRAGYSNAYERELGMGLPLIQFAGSPSIGLRDCLSATHRNRQQDRRPVAIARDSTRSRQPARLVHTPQVMAAQKVLFETWLNVGLQHGINTSVDVFAELFADPATVQAIAQYQTTRRARIGRKFVHCVLDRVVQLQRNGFRTKL